METQPPSPVSGASGSGGDGDEQGERSRNLVDGPMFGIDLGGMVFLRVLENGSELKIDIRQWRKNEAGGWEPTKHGVTMPLKRYKLLRDEIKDLGMALDRARFGQCVSEKTHLGGNMYAEVKTPYQCVQLRQWYQGQMTSTMYPGLGVSLKVAQWNAFVEADRQLDIMVPEITETLCCMEQTDHYNQIGQMACAECHPNGYNAFANWYM